MIVAACVTEFVIYGLWLLLAVIDDLGYHGNSYKKVLYLVFKNELTFQLSNFVMGSMQILVCVWATVCSLSN